MRKTLALGVLCVGFACAGESYENWQARHLRALKQGTVAAPSSRDAQHVARLRSELRAMKAKIDAQK